MTRQECRFGIERESSLEMERREYGCWCFPLPPKLGLNLALYLSAVSRVFLPLHAVHLPWAATDRGVELEGVFVRTVELGWTPGKIEATLVPCSLPMQPSCSHHRHHRRYGWDKLVHVEAQGTHGAMVLTHLHLHAQTTCLPTSPNTNMDTTNGSNPSSVIQQSIRLERHVLPSSKERQTFSASFPSKSHVYLDILHRTGSQPWRRLIQPLAIKLIKIPCPFLSKSQLL